jgi:hypothetical protein
VANFKASFMVSDRHGEKMRGVNGRMPGEPGAVLVSMFDPNADMIAATWVRIDVLGDENLKASVHRPCPA